MRQCIQKVRDVQVVQAVPQDHDHHHYQGDLDCQAHHHHRDHPEQSHSLIHHTVIAKLENKFI